MGYSDSSMSGVVSDYARLRTVPALLSIFFAMASLYQFGGVAELNFTWFNYTLTAQHGLIASLGIFALAFASSETRQFDNYEDWEKVLIAAGPVLLVAHQYIGVISTAFSNNAPMLPIIGFLISVASWGVAVR
jgi:hypothetical protein